MSPTPRLSDGAQARARHQGPLRAQRGTVQGRARPAARAAHAGRPLLARCLHPDGRLQERGRGRFGLVAVPGERAGGREAPVASTFPEEGVTGWADTTMLHVDAANPNCAYMWMEHSLSPKVQGDVSAWFGTVPSVPAACKGNALLTERAARPTAARTSTRSASGDPDRQMRQPGRMRALLPLGVRLCRRDRRTLI